MEPLRAVLGASVVWTVACVFLAWRYPREAARAGDAAWRARLERELAAADDDAARVLAVNEALGDVEHALARGRRLPATSGWLALGGVTMIMAAGAIHRPHPALLGALPVALVGLVACVTAGRRGRTEASRRRVAVDRVVDDVCGDLVGVEVVLPRRRSRGGRRSSRPRRRR